MVRGDGGRDQPVVRGLDQEGGEAGQLRWFPPSSTGTGEGPVISTWNASSAPSNC